MNRRSIFRYLASLALIPFVGVERAAAIRNASAEGDEVALFIGGLGPSNACGTSPGVNLDEPPWRADANAPWAMVGEGTFEPRWQHAVVDGPSGGVLWGLDREGKIHVADGVELRVIAGGQTQGWHDKDGWHMVTREDLK